MRFGKLSAAVVAALGAFTTVNGFPHRHNEGSGKMQSTSRLERELGDHRLSHIRSSNGSEDPATQSAQTNDYLNIGSVSKLSNSSGVQDFDILNIALSLGHMEAAFYTEGLNKFNATDFENAGLPDFARARFEEILKAEKTHVDTLSAILGANATNPCLYDFPLTNVKQFVEFSAILETAATASYTGMVSQLMDASFVTECASILANEARHAAWIKSAVLHQNPWSGPFETPLNLKQAFSLIFSRIEICPYTNPRIPISSFSSLLVSTPMNETFPGQNVTVLFWPPATSYADSSSSNSTNSTTVMGSNSTDSDWSSSNSTNSTNSNSTDSDWGASNSTSNSTTPQFYLALLSGLDTSFVPLTAVNSSAGSYAFEYTATLPSDLMGTVYGVVTSDKSMVMDNNTVAGVAIFDFPFDQNGTVMMNMDNYM